ncbi:MAG: YdbL family protein [Pseudomonadota bacterium]
MKKLIIAGLAATALLAGGAVALHHSGTNVAEARMNAKSIVDAAKTRGEVGEQIDGYLGIVSAAASADVRAAVNEINIGRKQVYTRLARDQNVRIEVVARLTGEKQIEKAAKGEYVLGETGQWTRK